MAALPFLTTNEGAAPASDALMFVPPTKKDTSNDVHLLPIVQ